MLLAAGSSSNGALLVLLSAAVSLLALVQVAVRVGRWINSVELRLDRHQTDLQHLGRAVDTPPRACPDPAAHQYSAGAPAASVLDQTPGGP